MVVLILAGPLPWLQGSDWSGKRDTVFFNGPDNKE